jgi:glucose/arabinose dehydrogenase
MKALLAAPLLLTGILAVTCNSSAAPAAPSWDKASPPPAAVEKLVNLEIVTKDLEQPVYLTYAPGDAAGRLFIVEKTGTIRILRGGVVEKTPFLDISKKVSDGSEQGLLGLAFHPKYKENGRLFINYTDTAGDTHVTEYKADAKNPDLADPASARELLKIEQPYSNHNGGHLLFGPDGLLYIGMGDGGSANDPKGNGQNKTSLLGKMLIMDVDAASPKPEIAALGMRNPWRYSFDRKTGELYIGDVGQNKYEEVHVVPAGKLKGLNFGWNTVEGYGHCLKKSGCDQAGLTLPVYEYTHGVGCSITGGYVYRGKALPELDGHYFYADYCAGAIRSFRLKGGKVEDNWDWKPRLDPEGVLATLSSFGEDPEGELYLLSLDGILYKFTRAK